MSEFRSLRLTSVSIDLPSVGRPQCGIFVRRRLAALAQLTELLAIRPHPWFPGLVRADQPANDLEFPTLARKMFYLPKVLKHWDSWWMQRAIGPQLRALASAGQVDVIDAHFGYPTGVACCRLARELDLPAFVTLRGVEAQQLKHPLIGPQIVAALTDCAGVIAVSHSLQQAALRAGIRDEQMRVIPNAVDTEVFHPGDQRECRALLGLPLDVPIIASVGSLIRRKGFHDVLPAFARLRESHPEAMLAIVGGSVRREAAYPGRIRRMIEHLGIQSSVRMAGAVHPGKVADWLRASDLFVLATSHEGCCNAVLEAMACGLPVVTTPAGDNERYIFPERNGFIVPIGDQRDLADRMTQALHHPWNRAQIAAEVQQYTWSDVAREVLAFMSERIGRSSEIAERSTPRALPALGRQH